MKCLAVVCLLVSSAFAQLPDAPSKTLDKPFLLATSVNVFATYADAATTLQFVGTKACPYEVGSPELFGKVPTASRTLGVMTAQVVGATLTAYVLKKHHVHIGRVNLWSLPLFYEATGHGYAAIQNVRNCQ